MSVWEVNGLYENDTMINKKKFSDQMQHEKKSPRL